MAMSPLPAVASGQPTATQGGKPAQEDRSAGGFAKLFAQASQPGKAAGGVEGNARNATNNATHSATNRSAGALADDAGELNGSDEAMTLASDGAQALLNLPAQAGGVLATREGALSDSQAAALAAATAELNPGGTGNGLTPGFAGDELAGIQERLDTLARFRDSAPLNPLGQAIAQVQQVSQQGGLERSRLSQAGGNALKTALDATDLKNGPPNGQPVSFGAGGTVADDQGVAGVSAAAGAANSASMGALSNGGATLNGTQQLQTQVAASPGGTSAQGEGGAWLSSISESLSAARTGNAETAVMPVHAGTGLGAGPGATPSAATASASVVQTPTLSAPLASAEWQQSLGQQLVNLQQRGGQRVQLHLNPAELGPLSITLKVDDQLAQAQFMSANPQVRAAVEQAIPQLREALGEAGIQLGEAMVGDQQPGQQQGQGDADARRVATVLEPGSSSAMGDALDGQALGNPGGLAINGVDLYA